MSLGGTTTAVVAGWGGQSRASPTSPSMEPTMAIRSVHDNMLAMLFMTDADLSLHYQQHLLTKSPPMECSRRRTHLRSHGHSPTFQGFGEREPEGRIFPQYRSNQTNFQIKVKELSGSSFGWGVAVDC